MAIKEKLRIKEGKAYGDALTLCRLKEERYGKKDIRVYIHIYDTVSVEYNVAPPGYPREDKIFYSYSSFSSFFSFDTLFLPNYPAFFAFKEAGWEKIKVKEKKGCVNVTVNAQLISLIEDNLSFSFSLSDFVNNSLAEYYDKEECRKEEKKERHLVISLGNNYIPGKRRAHMIDGFLDCEKGSVRIKDSYFYSLKELEDFLKDFVIKKDKEIIKEIRVKNQNLCRQLQKAGWNKVTCEELKSKEAKGEVLICMESISVKGVFDNGSVIYNKESFSDVNLLSVAICERRNLYNEKVQRIVTGNKEIRSDVFPIEYKENKRAIHANIHPELEKLLHNDKEKSSIIVERALEKYISKILA